MKINMTKKEKIICYKKAINLISDRGFNFSICPALMIYSRDNNIKDIGEMFPEFIKYKPKGKAHNSYWWPITHKKKRIKILQEIISELEGKGKL